ASPPWQRPAATPLAAPAGAVPAWRGPASAEPPRRRAPWRTASAAAAASLAAGGAAQVARHRQRPAAARDVLPQRLHRCAAHAEGAVVTDPQAPLSSANGARSDGMDASEEFSEEPELRRWLEGVGCTGLDRVGIKGAAGRKGLWLRKDPSEVCNQGYQDIFTVPQLAWLTAPLDSNQVEMELAWRLLCERWLGEASSHKPYVDFLWRSARAGCLWESVEGPVNLS
ncbi:unnamed protein product, partial [Prorocentrum cordatum]